MKIRDDLQISTVAYGEYISPLPALDGGRLVFLIVEAIRRKRVDPEKEGYVHLVGIVLLLLLMVVVMFNDIRNLIV